MAEDQLLEPDAGPESKHPGTKSADRPGGDLDCPGPMIVDPELRVNRAVLKSERGHGPAGGRGDVLLNRFGQAGRGHVDRLFEIRTFERIGLVKQGQDIQASPVQEPLQRDLGSRNIAFDEDVIGELAERGNVRLFQDLDDSVERRDESRLIIGPDHTAAGRQRERLENTGKGHFTGRTDGIVLDGEKAEFRRRQAGFGQEGSQAMLISGGLDRGR